MSIQRSLVMQYVFNQFISNKAGAIGAFDPIALAYFNTELGISNINRVINFYVQEKSQEISQARLDAYMESKKS